MRFLPLLFTVFLDSLGFGLAFPVLSPLIMSDTGGLFGPQVSLAAKGMVFSLFICSFCIGQFFGGPILGSLSDRKGRKKILLLSLWLAFLGYVISAISIPIGSVLGLIIGRLFSGAAAGNYAIVQSIIVDCSTDEDKSKNFGLLGMAWGSGFIIGPFIGGKLCDPHFADFCGWAAPFIFAAGLCLVNITLLALKLKETLSAVKTNGKVKVFEGLYHIKKAFRFPTLRYLFLVMFIFSFGWGFFTEFSGLFLIRRFGFDSGAIGNFYASVGIWVAVSQGILIRPFLKKFKAHSLLLGALLSLGFILPMMLLANQAMQVYFILPFLALAEAFIFPTASTLVSNAAPKESQGEILGIYNTVQWVAIGISPILSGSFVALYPHLPITVSSVSMLIGFFTFLWVLRAKKIGVGIE